MPNLQNPLQSPTAEPELSASNYIAAWQSADKKAISHSTWHELQKKRQITSTSEFRTHVNKVK